MVSSNIKVGKRLPYFTSTSQWSGIITVLKFKNCSVSSYHLYCHLTEHKEKQEKKMAAHSHSHLPAAECTGGITKSSGIFEQTYNSIQ